MTDTEQAKPLLVGVDFETYYDKDYSLVTLGSHTYVNDDRFDAYAVGIVWEDSEGNTHEWAGHPGDDDAPWHILHGNAFVAHNVGFDSLVFWRLQKDKVIPADIQPALYLCSADLAAYLSAQRALDKASPPLIGMEIDKTMRAKMKGTTLKEAEAKGWGKAGREYVLGDTRACFQIMKKYRHLWPEREQRIAQITREQGDRGICIDDEFVDEAVDHFRRKLFVIEQDIPWEQPEKAKTPIAHALLYAQCRKDGLSCPSHWSDDDEDFSAWEAKHAPNYPWIQAVAQWRKTYSILSKFLSIRERTREDGTMPFRLKYFGAHTGRMSGADGLNMQNLHRDAVDGFQIRNAFVPRPGHLFVILDYSQIEPRLLCYKSGDSKQMDQIRQGMEVYEVHARSTMGYNRPEPLAELAETDKEFATLRRLAKARVLGLGYGCGYVKFVKVAWNMARLEIGENESRKIVAGYRESNLPVTRYWSEHQKYLEFSVERRDKTHEIDLLSGRKLTFFNPQLRKVNYMGVAKWRNSVQQYLDYHFTTTWGGKLTENDIQAEGRDIMCDGLLRSAEAGFPPLWTIHDEFVFEVPEDKAEEALSFLTGLLQEAPPWLPNFPLAVAGGITRQYQKM